MKKYISSIAAALLLLGTACSDHFEPFDTNSTVEESENDRISYFDLDPLLIILESTDQIGYANLKSGFFDLTTHNVEFKRSDKGYRCGIYLQESNRLEDGEYLLTFSDSEHQPITGMLKVKVKDEHIVEIGEAKSSFSLRNGSGTQEDPYIIGSERDFITFLDDLRDNELTNGRDCYFLQTADITLTDQSSTKPGRGYFGFSFAGNYNGGGFAMKDMYYRGGENAEKDSRIGIFPTLLDGASVSNLIISGANISATHSDTGTLAGTISGTVILSNLKMTGSVISEKASNVGAFIGRMEKGNLVASTIHFSGTVEGNKNIGGLIGSIDNGTVDISDFATPDYHFAIEGYENIGGIVGYANNSNIKVNDSGLTHVVSKEDADIRLVRSTGGPGAGGIFGALEGSTSAELCNVEVSCPVGGLNRVGGKVGGLIGKATATGNLTLNSCRVTSIVSGGKEIGGYIGHCEITGNGKLIIKGDSKENYIIPDDSAAGIEGAGQVGGAIGQMTKTAIQMQSQAKIRIAVNVEASECDCGGAIGKLTESNIDLTCFDMTSITMQVKGIKCTGGMVGYAKQATISGNTPFNYPTKDGFASIPNKDNFTPVFKGIVKGENLTGGILGWGENVTIKAIASECTVEATEGDCIGGIVGKISSKGNSDLIEDIVSKSTVKAVNSSYVGGVVGFLEATGYCLTTDCINFASIEGGNSTGGVFGYVHHEYFLADKDDPNFKPLEIRWCYNDAHVYGTNRVGGIIGEAQASNKSAYWYLSDIWIYKCGNNGTVSSDIKTEEASGVGGIIGYGEERLLLEHNTNMATINSSSSHKGVGGIAGSLGDDATKSWSLQCYNVGVYQCVNNGVINSTDPSSRVGGILGFMEEGPDAILKNCLNRGDVLHKHNSDNGGILGYIDHLGHIYYCVNIGKVEEGNGTVGTHKTGSIFYHEGLYLIDGSGWTWPSATVIKKEDLCNASKYSWLNFDSVWEMTASGPSVRDCPFDFYEK